MRLPRDSALPNALDQLRNAGEAGLGASRILSVLDIRPLPLAIDVVRELVRRGLVTADPSPVNVASTLRITANGAALLDEETRAGRWGVGGLRIVERSPEQRAEAARASREEEARRVDEARMAYERARAVMTEGLRPRLDAGAVEMVRALLSPAGAFAIATPEACWLHPANAHVLQPPRLSLGRLAAAIAVILSLGGVAGRSGSTVLGIARGELASSIGGFACVSFGPSLAWVVLDAHCIRLLVRPAPALVDAPFSRPIPADGPLARSPSGSVRGGRAPALQACGGARFRPSRPILAEAPRRRDFLHARGPC